MQLIALFATVETTELIFEVRDAEEGGFVARALGHAIFTEAETWDELRANVLEAATLHFEGNNFQPLVIQLHRGEDEAGILTPDF
jgi:predicted RNase H-like HicB family nuclease